MDEANDMSQFWGRLLREDDTNNSSLVDQLLQQYQEEQTLHLNLNSHTLSKPLNSIDSSLFSPASVDVAGLDEDLARRYANLKKSEGIHKKSEGIHKGSHENSGKVQKNHENPLNTNKNSGDFEDTNKKPVNFNDTLKNSEGTHKNLGKFEVTLNKFQDTLKKTEGTPENSGKIQNTHENSGKIQNTHENSLNFKDNHENALNFNVTNESFKDTLDENKGEKIRDDPGKFVPVDEEELQILGSELASRFAALKANSFKGLENPTITLESRAGNPTSEVETSLFERGPQNPNMGNANEDEVKRLLASVQDAMRLVQDKVSGSLPSVAFDDKTEKGDDSEVERIVEWAKDAARLDPNSEEVESDGDFEDDDDDDTSNEDESSANHKKKKLSSRSRK